MARYIFFWIQSVKNSKFSRWELEEKFAGDEIVCPWCYRRNILTEVSVRFISNCKETIILHNHKSSNSKSAAFLFTDPLKKKKKITPTDNYCNLHLFLLSPLPAVTVTLLHASLLTKNNNQLLPQDTAYLCLLITIPPSPQKWNSHSCCSFNLPFFVSTTSQDPDLFQTCRKEQNL